MAIVAGIDEAGYGPLLGPMVCSATVFALPDERADCSLWELLDRSVAPRRSGSAGRVVVGDSKRLFHRGSGLALLERSVLAFASQLGRCPGGLTELLERLGALVQPQLDTYPWYRDQQLSLPVAAAVDGVSLRSALLGRDMAAQGVKLEMLRSELLLEGLFNRMVAATGNKATVLFSITCRLVQQIYQRFGGQHPVIWIDKQGGRNRYRRVLMRSFPYMRLRIVCESADRSEYLLRGGQGQMRIIFAANAEDRQLPVALASMLCKYLRELFMLLLNRFWQGHVRGLPPTAGYYSDALRYLRQIRPAMARLNIPERMLVRQR